MEIGTYATTNVRTGNLTLSIPLVGWTGLGPDVGFMLYHNSNDASATPPPSDGSGFSLGAGWRISYGGKVVPQGSGPPFAGVHVVEDDGVINVFRLISGSYVAPTGIYDRLEGLPSHNSPTSLEADAQGSVVPPVRFAGPPDRGS